MHAHTILLMHQAGSTFAPHFPTARRKQNFSRFSARSKLQLMAVYLHLSYSKLVAITSQHDIYCPT